MRASRYYRVLQDPGNRINNEMLLYPNPPRPHKPAVDNAGGAAMSNLPNNWDRMPVGALWDATNDSSRFATPQSAIEAIMHSVRARGIAALEEVDNVERLSRCDEAALAEIKRRCLQLRPS